MDRMNALREKIHRNLITELIQGHVGPTNSPTYNRWRGGFANYCNQTTQLQGSVVDNFDYLEDSDQISPGNYAVLRDIFTGDGRAREKIDAAIQEIQKIERSSDSNTRPTPVADPSAGQLKVNQGTNRTTNYYKIKVGITNSQHSTAERMILSFRDLIRDLQRILNGTSPIEEGYRIVHDGEYRETSFGIRVQEAQNKLVDMLRGVCSDNIMRKSNIVLEIWFDLLRYLERTCEMSVCGIGWENSIVLVVKTGTSFDQKKLKLEVRSRFRELFSTIGQGDDVVNLVSLENLSSSDADSLIKRLNSV